MEGRYRISDQEVRFAVTRTKDTHFGDAIRPDGTIEIRAPRRMPLREAEIFLEKHADRTSIVRSSPIHEEISLTDGGWHGGTFSVAGRPVPYSVIINKRRKYPCLIIQKNENIRLETPVPMTRAACEEFLKVHENRIIGIFQKDDTTGSFNNGTITIDGEEIPYYIVVNKKMKRITTGIRDDLTIEVRSPYPLSEEQAVPLIMNVADWVRDARIRKSIQVHKRQVRRYEEGETIPFQGRTLTIRHLRSDGGISASIVLDELHITLSSDLRPEIEIERIRSAVMESYYHAILPVAEGVAERASRLIGVSPPFIRFGYQRKRFGSCTPRNGIILNLRLAMAPPAYLEYTIIHEVCHLIEKNHQKPFWDLVASVLPDYARYHKDLQRDGMTYIF